MSEQDIRDGLRAAVWDEPPLNFDPDSLIQRAEQVTKRRRALVSVGTATALIIATIMAVPVVLSAGRQSVDTAASSLSTTPIPSSSEPMPSMDWPPKGVRRVNHEWSTLQPRLLEVWPTLSGNLQRAVTTVSDIGPWKPDFKPDWHVRDSSVADVVNGPVTYVDEFGPATLDVTIAGPGAWTVTPAQICQEARYANLCAPVRRPDGSLVVTVECSQSEKLCTVGIRNVYHYRLDGSVVAMTSMADLSVGNSPRREAPMSFGQLIDLVTEPALRLTG